MTQGRLTPKSDGKKPPKLKRAVDRGFQQRYGKSSAAPRKRTGDNDSGKAWLE